MSFKIVTDKSVSDNKYKVTISIPKDEISAVDSELLVQFGEPEVQVGGTVTGPTNVVTLPPLLRRIPSGFPHSESFDGDDYIDAEDLANTWAATTLAAITAAIDDLRTNSAAGFEGQSVVTH